MASTIHTAAYVGDSIADGPACNSPACRFFNPEMFMTVVLRDPLRKQLRQVPDAAAGRGRRDPDLFEADAGSGNALLGADRPAAV